MLRLFGNKRAFFKHLYPTDCHEHIAY